MPAKFWLVKSEPGTYSWADLQKDKKTTWVGVRNFTARNYLRAMKKGDLALFYHSGATKDVVGVAKVVKEAYPDATAKEGDWSVVDLAAVKSIAQPVTLADVKADAALADMQLVTHSRLSVQSVTPKQWKRVLVMGKTRL